MKILFMAGGLGNQLLRYIFARYIEEATGEEVIFDDSLYILKDEHNGYELERIFGIRTKRISDIISFSDIKGEANELGMYEYLLSKNPYLNLVAEFQLYRYLMQYLHGVNISKGFDNLHYSLPSGTFCPSVSKLQGDLYYYGLWWNPFWFYAIKDKIVNELRFPEIKDPDNQRLKKSILNSNSVGIHIRLGDSKVGKFSAPLDMEFCKTSVEHIKGVFHNPAFFIFTDDKSWVGRNYLDMGLSKHDNLTFVTENRGLNDFIDMQLMSYCKSLIAPNSSFSSLATLLNQHQNKYVIRPGRITRPSY